MKKIYGLLILIVLSGSLKAQYCPDGVKAELLDYTFNVLCSEENITSLRLSGALRQGSAYFMGGTHTFSWSHDGKGSFTNQSANPGGNSTITYNVSPDDYTNKFGGVVKITIEVQVNPSWGDCTEKYFKSHYYLILNRFKADAGPDQHLCSISDSPVPVNISITNYNSSGDYIYKWKSLGSGTFENENQAGTNYIPSLSDINNGSVRLVAQARKVQCLSNDVVTDTLILHFETCTGISSLNNNSSLQIYPNPVSDYIFIKSEGSTGYGLLKIYSPNGTIVFEKQISDEEYIPIQFHIGIYNAVLYEAGKVLTRKFEVY